MRDRRILITGAAGFIGRALLKLLLRGPTGNEIVSIDLGEQPPWASDSRVRWVRRALDDRAAMDDVCRSEFDLVYHLASVPGSRAETDSALGRRVNLDASLDLLDRIARWTNCPRVVFASSIAVYGTALSAPVSSKTPSRPAITYGAHKRMVEIALADHTRRGEMSGISVRLPGVVARPGPATGFGSAFMSELLRSLAAGQPYECPVSPRATAWWLSVRGAAKSLQHAGTIAHCGEIQLPALHLSVEEVVDGVSMAYGGGRSSLVRYRRDDGIEAIFGRLPELHFAEEQALGFTHDGTISALVRDALGEA